VKIRGFISSQTTFDTAVNQIISCQESQINSSHTKHCEYPGTTAVTGVVLSKDTNMVK